jgi:hypothetical protein
MSNAESLGFGKTAWLEIGEKAPAFGLGMLFIITTIFSLGNYGENLYLYRTNYRGTHL